RAGWGSVLNRVIGISRSLSVDTHDLELGTHFFVPHVTDCPVQVAHHALQHVGGLYGFRRPRLPANLAIDPVTSHGFRGHSEHGAIEADSILRKRRVVQGDEPLSTGSVHV